MAEHEGSYVRWQQIRLEQFSFVTNLLLGLATGVLALEIPIALGDKPPTGATAAFLFASASFLSLSVAVGLVLAWNRLKSFRLTARKARMREQEDARHAELRREIDALDDASWRLIKWQTALFAVGAASVALVIFGHTLRRACGTPSGGPANNQMQQTMSAMARSRGPRC